MPVTNDKNSPETGDAANPSIRDRAVICTRVFTKGPMGMAALRVQEKACRDLCNRMGWDVVQVFEERGEAAKTVNRAAFRRMLDYCKNKENRVKYAVVLNWSRLVRRPDDQIFIKAVLKRVGVTLSSVTEPSDESPAGRFMVSMIAVLEQFDREVRSLRRSSSRR